MREKVGCRSPTKYLRNPNRVRLHTLTSSCPTVSSLYAPSRTALTIPAEPVKVSVVPLLSQALNRIRSTPPRIIQSPPTQPRRAAVALVIRVAPPPNYPPILPYQSQPSLTDFFQLDWVNAPGARPEILFLKRDSQEEDAAAIANNRMNSTSEAHVAFPGGRMEEGDEGGSYTGTNNCAWLKYPKLTSTCSNAPNMGGNWPRLGRARLYLHWSIG